MPKEFSVGEAMSVVRSKLNLKREQGLILLAGEGRYMLKHQNKLEEVY